MRLVATIFLLGALALSIVVYYMFANVVFAIWFPDRARRQWVDFARSPTIELSRPFFKWVMPVLLILLPLWLAWQALEVTLE